MKKKNIALFVCVLIGTIAFFTYRMIVTYDSAHYLWLSSLLGNMENFRQWDVARGIVLPMIIRIGNLILGTNSNSLLVISYIAYLVTLAVCYKMYKKTIKTDSRIIKGIVIALFTIMVVLNPVIFAYYHIVLTEFVAMTIAILFCYISWKFMDINFKENRRKYILYTIAFSLGAMIMWQLKQPYVTTVVLPLFWASFISIIRNFKKENIIQKLVVCFISILSIVLSIVLWNGTLKIFKVNIEEDRTSSGYFTVQLIGGVSDYRVFTFEKDRYTRSDIEKDQFISAEEKEETLKIIDEKSEKNKSFLVIERLEAPGKPLAKKVLFSESESIQIKDAVRYLVDTVTHHPGAYFKNLVDNYLTIADVYKLDMVNNVFFIGKDDLKWGTICENGQIGYRVFQYDAPTVFPVSEKLQPYTTRYVDTQKPIIAVNFVMQKLEVVSTVLFKVAIVVLPFYLIGLIVVQIVTRKKYNKEFKNILDLNVIMAGFSFIHIFLHVVIIAIIDRYAMPTTIPLYISYILTLYLIINNKKYRLNDK